ncbi:multicopper oxidase family protein [Xylanimonas sp. McL0601]|uniref:multicopper oxidase family protein n=1 Tax=Xylanimonas sp. McL0601 TaxID=3414739 RepID=UPI003CF3C314
MRENRYLIGAVAFAVAAAVPLWGPSLGGDASTGTTDVHGAAAAEAHGAAGMASPATTGNASGADLDWQAMDRAMAERAKAFPAKTAGEGAQVLKPTILEDGTKQFTLTAGLVDWEVEPGKVVKAMAYNGMVPGPTLRVDVGDKVEVVLKNELPQSTVIHWHGIPVTNEMDGVADITQPPVPPGGSFTYKINADRQSVGWYHSHHNGSEQVGAGLWGAFVIGDLPLPGGAKADHEAIMQLQDSGAIGLTLNGKSFPATKPLEMKLGESMLIHYINAGSTPHPMHLHGVDQLVVAKDGFPLAQPYKADTVLVAPGERYSVLVVGTKRGSWGFHCHIFPHSEGSDGMFGMFTELRIS